MLTVSTPVVRDRVVSFAVAGEIDMATVGPLDGAMAGAVTRGGVTAVVIDFAAVTFCDSCGLAALDRAYAAALQRSVGFRLINVGPVVRRVLEIVGMFDTLTRPGQAES